MISNALATTGAYADWWGYLKSIDHALGRVLDSTDAITLGELDADRLRALCDLLDDALYFSTATTGDEESQANAFKTPLKAPDFSPFLSLTRFITKNDSFNDWAKPRNKNFETNLKRLLKILNDCIDTVTELVPHTPSKELIVLRAIVSDMLDEAELALYR